MAVRSFFSLNICPPFRRSAVMPVAVCSLSSPLPHCPPLSLSLSLSYSRRSERVQPDAYDSVLPLAAPEVSLFIYHYILSVLLTNPANDVACSLVKYHFKYHSTREFAHAANARGALEADDVGAALMGFLACFMDPSTTGVPTTQSLVKVRPCFSLLLSSNKNRDVGCCATHSCFPWTYTRLRSPSHTRTRAHPHPHTSYTAD